MKVWDYHVFQFIFITAIIIILFIYSKLTD